MSSVLIKAMKMPKNCVFCWLSRMRGSSLGGILDCKILGTVGTAMDDPYDILNKRHPDCPLVELPEKHGRLIEEPKYFDYSGLAMIAPLDFKGTAEYFARQVKAQPTIIEAEGDEE